MPAPVVVAAGITALGSLFGNKSNNRASRDAMRMEADATNRALAQAREDQEYERQRYAQERAEEQRRYEDERAYSRGRTADETGYARGQRADYLGRLDPYNAAGTGAITRLSDILGGGRAGGGGGAMVKLQSPTGEVRDVPEAQAQHYIQMGAKRIG